MQYTSQQLRKIYKELPEDIKEAIDNIDATYVIDEVGKKFNLHLDQISKLGEETGFVLLGVADPMEFVSNISEKLGIDKNIASQIVGEINEKIFVDIKESLREVHSKPRPRIETPAKEPVAPNLIKTIETGKLEVPKKAMDILRGNIPVPKKKSGTEIFGFSSEKKNDLPAPTPQTKQTGGHLDIMEEKMKGVFSIPKVEDDLSKNQPQRVTDPYREQI